MLNLSALSDAAYAKIALRNKMSIKISITYTKEKLLFYLNV